jgi:cbb3-type cytochrome oxidase cytochrome c subunit
MPTRLAAVALLLSATLTLAAPPIDRAAVKRGLVFTTAGPGGATLSRLEPGVGMTLAAGERADPQGAGAVGETLTWAGTINVLQAAPYRFDATLQGQAVVTVGDVVVFQGEAAEAKRVQGAAVELPAGIQPFKATLTRTVPAAQLELIWSGPGFVPEPVPYYFFGHLPAERPAGFTDGVQRDRGRFLVEEHACVKCHAAGDAAKLAERTGPNLSKVGERTSAAWIDAWLKDPHALRPDTVMPKLFADDAAGATQRYAVAVYLSGLGKPKPAADVGLREMSKSIAAGQRVYVLSGCAACHGEQVTTGQTAARPLGEEEEERKPPLAEEGVYGLGTGSPRIKYTLGHPGSKFTPEALEKYLRDPLATNPHGRMPASNLSGPDTRDLARFLARFTDDKLAGTLRDAPVGTKRSAKEWATLGKQVYAEKGCVNCHAIDGDKAKPVTAKPLAALTPDAGCLAAKPDPAKLSAYSLDAGQKAATGVFLKSLAAGPHAASPAYSARADFKRFGCLNCHNRDGEGGLEDGLVDKMKPLETAANADDVNPPRLTQVGHKLRESWLREVLLKGGRTRPWMSLRMPQYGAANVGHLVTDLPKTEGTVPDDTAGAADFTAEKVAAGRTLAGKTENGMGCVACHDISGVPGGGTRGPDLALTRDRVRLGWFTRWMHQPQRLAPGTKMPTNFLNGKSLVPAIYDGDADKQIEALWDYFALGPGLPLPAGMEPPPGLTVIVGAKPIVLRTFMPDAAGTRPVAVGFPGGINVAFDTATGRVSYAWAGNFLDAKPVWDGRGGNPAKLLGPTFYRGPVGFPWATGTEPPDFRKRFADPEFGHLVQNDGYAGPRRVHFKGYAVDAAGGPHFTTELRDTGGSRQLEVSETVTPLPVRTAPGFRRTFTVKPTGDGTTWLCVDTVEGGTAKVEGNRAVVTADGRVTVYDLVAAPENASWEVMPGNGLLLKLPTPPTKPLVLDTWGVARNDPALLKGLRP